jgi:hypothetical protein
MEHQKLWIRLRRIIANKDPAKGGAQACQIVQRVSLERRHENHDRAIDDIGEAGKNVKTPGDPIYNPGCLALTRQQRYVVWPDKFKPDIGAHYDRTTNPIEFLQLYVIVV